MARWDRGRSYLYLGNYRQGWPDYKIRRVTGQLPRRKLPGEQRPLQHAATSTAKAASRPRCWQARQWRPLPRSSPKRRLPTGHKADGRKQHDGRTACAGTMSRLMPK
jgi:hypothetical protein